MNRLFFLITLSACMLQSCGMKTNWESDEPAADTTQAAKLPDSVPREVRVGKDASWAFKPDSCFNELLLGDVESFKIFWRTNGAKFSDVGNKRQVAHYLNQENTELLEVYITKNKKGKEVPYSICLQKVVNGFYPDDALEVNKRNFITGHNIHIGMLASYVQRIYTDQAMTQWQKGDTLYLVYKPKPKDAKHFTRFSHESYTATYKFVDEYLRRIEYTVDPAELEKQ
jgi:hypothetical protein